jgi:N-acetylglucosamine-6-phosphate deacetylase
MQAFVNGRIFTGKHFLSDHALLEDEGKVIDVVPDAQVPSNALRVDARQSLVVPAFIDLQLYGGNGMLFADHPSIESIAATVTYSIRGGAAYIMPTIPTHTIEIMHKGAEAVRAYWRSGGKAVLGMHAEGPFLNPQKRGAHILDCIQSPTLSNLQHLMQGYEDAIRFITIAPELFNDESLKYLQALGIVISAGHTNATYAEATRAFDNGLPVATHLFNAMSALQHRAPGVVGAILHHPAVRSSIVVDGHHVDYPAVTLAKRLMHERLFLITDAVTANAEGFYKHQFSDGKYVMPDGTLSGSSLTMAKAVQNCVRYADIPLEEALRMASLYPAGVMHKEKRLGRLEKGYEAQITFLDKELEVVGTYVHQQQQWY